MAFLTPGYRKRGAVYDEAKAAAADEARRHDLGYGYIDEDLVVEQVLALVGCPCAKCGKRSTLPFEGTMIRVITDGS